MTADTIDRCITISSDPSDDGAYTVIFQTDHPCIYECRQSVQHDLEVLFRPIMLSPGPVTVCLRGHARSSSVVILLLIVRLLAKVRVPNIELCCEYRNTNDLLRNIRIDVAANGLMDLIKHCDRCEHHHHSHTRVRHQH